MTTRRTSKTSKTAAAKFVDISLAAPQVVAHRVARMANSGPVLSERDRKEFTGMVAEKQVAFSQSWMIMSTEMFKLQQQMLVACMRNPWTWGWNLPSATERVLAKGMEPVRSKAVSNARRLNKTPFKF